MKEGYLLPETGKPAEGDLEQINKLSRRVLREEEVFVFSVVLCDNEIDRDLERFTDAALDSLSELFVGKTGIFDHSMKGRDQLARIFACQVERVEGQTTRSGEAYRRLKARAYMPRTARNEDLILEIDAGIKKEVSVGCSVGAVRCSICGADLRRGECDHVKGRFYRVKGKKELCCALLDEPTDAYEWSFVAVPAQPQAGVVKAFAPQGEGADETGEEALLYRLASGADKTVFNKSETSVLLGMVRRLQDQADGREKFTKALRDDVVRLSGLTQPALRPSAAKRMADALDEEGLLELKKSLEEQLDRMLPPIPQLASEQTENLNAFCI